MKVTPGQYVRLVWAPKTHLGTIAAARYAEGNVEYLHRDQRFDDKLPDFWVLPNEIETRGWPTDSEVMTVNRLARPPYHQAERFRLRHSVEATPTVRMYARATRAVGGLNTSRLELTRLLLQPWDNKPYRSWPKLRCDYIPDVSIPDHSAATLASCGPIHLVGHLKPRGPVRQAGIDLKLFGPGTRWRVPRESSWRLQSAGSSRMWVSEVLMSNKFAHVRNPCDHGDFPYSQ